MASPPATCDEPGTHADMAPILIVDDETTLARNIATFLVRHGYDVRCVETAEEALAALDAFRPAIVLQDFNLPGMDGLAMLTEIRRRDRRIKVIMMTAQDGTQVAVAAIDGGAHAYLTKPLVLAKLKTMLEQMLSRERVEEPRACLRGGQRRRRGEADR
jgi:two-component system C4-dicarboxylate transport response regulator DctD